MSIYKKTILMIVTTTLVLTLALSYIIQTITGENYREFERNFMRIDTQRVINHIDSMVKSFSEKWYDYAAWDDTYNYIEKKDSAYIDSNYSNEWLYKLNLNLLVLLDSKNEPVYGTLFNRDKKEREPVPPDFLKTLIPLCRFEKNDESKSGFIKLGQNVYIISVLPVTNTDTKAKPNGSFIVGRAVDTSITDRVTAELLVPASIRRVDSKNLEPYESELLKNIPAEKQIIVKGHGENMVAGYSVVNDIFGSPLLFLTVNRREINFNNFIIGSRFLRIAIVMTSLVFGAIIMYFLHFGIVLRIGAMSSEIKNLSSREDLSARIRVPGNDEISVIGIKINELLATRQKMEETISERTQKLEKAMVLAESANRLKSEFLANMSHEIRTPINSIIGFSDMLAKMELNTEQSQMLEYVRLSSNSLLVLINDILDFSKIEAEKLELENVEFDINKAAWEVMSIINPMAVKKKLELIIEGHLPIERNVIGDPSRLRQILLNLVSNAIKFTEKGKVSIELKLIETSPEKVRIRFDVADEGIGISEEIQQMLFKPFTQADRSTTRKFGGTGLGLAISDKLAKMMGAERIFLESSPAKGSRFYFTLEFKLGGLKKDGEFSDAAIQMKKDARQTAHYKVLLAEDNNFTQILTEKLLNFHGHSVKIAETGQMAIDMLEKEEFDVILMDVHMPIMDGLEATRRIREKGLKLPIIAMTASAMKGDDVMCRDAGMNAYVSKPINIEAIEHIIAGIVSKKTATTEAGNIPSETPVDAAPKSGEPEIFNARRVKRNLGCVKGLIEASVNIFIETFPEYSGSVKKAFKDKNDVELKMSAHLHKGAALNAGADKIADILLKIEKMAESKEFENVAPLLSSLDDEFDNYCSEVKKRKIVS